MKMKKLVCLILLLSLLLALPATLSSCAEKREVFMTLDGIDVPYDMVRYFVMSYKAEYTSEELSDPKVIDQIEINSLASIKEFYAYKKLARELSITLSSEDKKAIRDTIKEMKAYYDSDKEYNKDQEKYFASDAVIRDIVETELLCDKIYDRLTIGATDDRFKSDNETIDNDLKTDKWFSFEYMYLTFTDENKEERETFMKSARADVASGINMQTICNDNTKLYLSDITYAIDGCFTTTIYNEIYEEKVAELEIGETSEVFTYGNSFCIIRRLSISDDYVSKNYNSIIAQYLAREFFNYVAEIADSLTPVMAEKYEGMRVTDINE